MHASDKEVKTDKTDKGLLPVYLFVGDDKLKVTALEKRLLQRLQQSGDVTFNSQTFDAGLHIDVELLLDALNTPPLASPLRLVTVRDVDKAGQGVLAALVSYLHKPLTTTVLVLIATKLTANSRLLKAVESVNPKAVIDTATKKRSEMPHMVRQLAQSYGITISHDATLELLELVGNSTVALNTEMQKLASFAQAVSKNHIALEDVRSVVSRSNQYSVWDFVDAFSKRDLLRCVTLLNVMPKESSLSLLALCTIRVRELLQVKALEARGNSNVTRELHRPAWQVQRLQRASGNFSSERLRQILALIAQTDMRMKSEKDPRQALIELLVFACG